MVKEAHVGWSFGEYKLNHSHSVAWYRVPRQTTPRVVVSLVCKNDPHTQIRCGGDRAPLKRSRHGYSREIGETRSAITRFDATLLTKSKGNGGDETATKKKKKNEVRNNKAESNKSLFVVVS